MPKIHALLTFVLAAALLSGCASIPDCPANLQTGFQAVCPRSAAGDVDSDCDKDARGLNLMYARCRHNG